MYEYEIYFAPQTFLTGSSCVAVDKWKVRALCAREYYIYAQNHTSVLIGGNLALHLSREWYSLNLSCRQANDLQHKVLFFLVTRLVFVLFHFYYNFLY